MDLKLTTSEITTLRTRRKGRERFWLRLSSAPAVGGGELARIVFETSSVSSVTGFKSAFSRYSSTIEKIIVDLTISTISTYFSASSTFRFRLS